MTLRDWLMQRQRELKESDRTFAARLAVTGALWGMVRRNEQRVTLRLVRAARRAFPEAADLIAKLALECDDDNHFALSIPAGPRTPTTAEVAGDTAAS